MRRLLEALGDVADMIGGAGYRVREALSPSARTVDTPPPRVEQTLTDADVSDYARATEASLGLVLSTMAVGSEEAARQTAIGYVLAAGTFLARVGMRP